MRTVLQVEDILDKEGEVMIYNTCEIYNTAAHANTPSTKISTTDIASSSTLAKTHSISYIYGPSKDVVFTDQQLYQRVVRVIGAIPVEYPI